MRALSRRGFLAGGVAAAGALAVGCGGRFAGDVDTFTAAFQGSGAGEGIDPGVNTLFIDEARMKAVYDGLFEIDGAMRPIPRLAASGEPNADGTRWRIVLRDARWHDGKKVTSRDVLYTLSRVLGPPQRRPFIAAATLDQVDLSQSRAVDDLTVEIALRTPGFEFLQALSAYGTKIVQDGATDFSRPVGTGPFVFESFDAGREFSATAYDHYWDGAPSVRRLRIVSAEPDARLAAVQSGQIDFADNLTPSAARTLQGRQGVSLESTPNSGIYFFAMKTDRPPFDNPDVRRAVMRMVDRAELVKVALEGQGDVGNDVFGKGYQYYADLPQHDYNPDEAGRLLRKAGVRDLSFDLFTAPVAHGFVEAARLFAEQAARCGVRVNVVLGSKDSYYTDALNTGPLTMGQSGPLSIPSHFASRLLTGSPQNRTKWSDPEFDALYAKAQATPTETGRAAVYRMMHEILYDRGGFVFFGNTHWNSATGAKFRDTPAAVPNSHDWARFDKVVAG
ncbi:peptide/nickel transport system substrate-binding protein [Nocardia transvalensis]|uniref:Peptide/nickel transport system substrate-binding protein n=1 Tax=Nocardia transvalensis TaxID=37333 RepID=A0A7W9PLY9_9NOCA|nr:ABC transporter substrate-binding protein [Nocardia transvalensis]MBB5918501.1 peptide/nickel transport system substrate-binding protein [Nocardia transvalensis]